LALRGLGNLVVGHVLRAIALVRRYLGQRCRGGRLAVVDVADRANVHVRLGAVELCLGHLLLPLQVGAPVAARSRFLTAGAPTARPLNRNCFTAKLATGIEPVTSSLPRMCSAD